MISNLPICVTAKSLQISLMCSFSKEISIVNKMSNKTFLLAFLLFICVVHLNRYQALACRVGSDKLKAYAQKSIARFLSGQRFKSIYWLEEPLNPVPIAKVTGLNIKSAITKFSLGDNMPNGQETEAKLLHDIIVTCSSDKNRLYTLTINLEINNPFKVVELEYQPTTSDHHHQNEMGDVLPELLKIQIHLPQSALLVQLDQKISYDGCLEVSYVQLAPNVVYDIKCPTCDTLQQKYLDNIFSKKMSQLDSELDPLLSEKISLSLKNLLSQHRLDLDLFMS